MVFAPVAIVNLAGGLLELGAIGLQGSGWTIRGGVDAAGGLWTLREKVESSSMRCGNSKLRSVAEAGWSGGISSVGLTAMVVALHVSVLTRRLSRRSASVGTLPLLIWQLPTVRQGVMTSADQGTSSHPVRNYCFGRLSLSVGIVVIALAAWLHIIHSNGTLGH